MKRYASNTRIPMLPTGSRSSGTGLLEKRVFASSGLGLVDSVSWIGDRNFSVDDTLDLDSVVDWHNNHGNDPATDTLGISDSVDFNIDRTPSLTSNLLLQDHVHAVLEGYHPSGGSSEFDAIAGETVFVGQPVYVVSNNTVNLADASDTTMAKAIGFVTQSATANTAVVVQTDGLFELANWEAIIGAISLTPGSTYFLSTVTGQMSTTPPTGDGDTVVTMGTAVSTTKFDIEVNEVAIL
jgi:hypothetical protein